MNFKELLDESSHPVSLLSCSALTLSGPAEISVPKTVFGELVK